MNNNFLLKFVTFFLVAINLIIYYMHSIGNLVFLSNKTVGIIVLVTNFLLIIWFRRNVLGVIVSASLFYFNYSIIVFNYFSFSKSMFWGYNGTPIATQSLYIILLFISFLILGVIIFGSNNSKITNDEITFDEIRYNPYLGVAISVILIFIFFFGFSRGDLGDRGTPSTFYEYSVILFILLAYFTGKSRVFKNINIGLMLIYAAQNLVFAGRITALQVLIILYLLYFKDIISTKTIIILAISGFFFFSLIGTARGALFTGDASIESTINEIRERKFALDTAFAAYFTSETFVDYKSYVNFPYRINQFLSFLLSMIFGGGNIANSNLSLITHSFRIHYFGGVLPFYFFFWFGSLGVCIASTLVLLYTQLIGFFKKSDLVKMISFYIASTASRWYLYSPSNLIRGVLIFSVLFIICNIFHKITIKRRYSF